MAKGVFSFLLGASPQGGGQISGSTDSGFAYFNTTASWSGSTSLGATANVVGYAIANPGYTFINWSNGATELTTNATYSFATTVKVFYQANFSESFVPPPNYTIDVFIEPTGSGTVTGSGVYVSESVVALTANTNSLFVFNGWYIDTTLLSPSSSYEFSASGDVTITASFYHQPSVFLNWSYDLADETGFLIQRSTDSASTWTINFSTQVPVTYSTDWNVVRGGSYWYHVAAANTIGTGSFGNTVYVFVPAGPPPGGTPNLTASIPQFKLYWNYTDVLSGQTASFNDAAPITSSGNTRQQTFTVNYTNPPLEVSSITLEAGNFEQPILPSLPHDMGTAGPFDLMISSSSPSAGIRISNLTITPTVGDPFIIQLRATYP